MTRPSQLPTYSRLYDVLIRANALISSFTPTRPHKRPWRLRQHDGGSCNRKNGANVYAADTKEQHFILSPQRPAPGRRRLALVIALAHLVVFAIVVGPLVGRALLASGFGPGVVPAAAVPGLNIALMALLWLLRPAD